MSERHEMHQVCVYETGVEEWKCEQCGRHFLMQHEPFLRLILTEGTIDVSHYGSTGNVNVSINTESDDIEIVESPQRLH